jgi:hypothetical protein
MKNNELKLSPFWNDENLWKGKSEWRKAKPGNGLNLSVFRDFIIERFSDKTIVEDIDYIEIKDETKLIEK